MNYSDLLVQGLVEGCIYALIAVGLTLVYGLLRILHIAHAGIFTLGAYVGLLLTNETGSFAAAFVITVVAVGFFGMAFYRLFYEPLLDKPPHVALIASIGLFVAMEEIYRIVFGATSISFLAPPLKETVEVAGVRLEEGRIVVVILAVVLIGGLAVLAGRTRIGIAWRATVSDAAMAESFGIDLARVRYINFFVASALAAAAGIMVAFAAQPGDPDHGRRAGLQGAGHYRSGRAGQRQGNPDRRAGAGRDRILRHHLSRRCTGPRRHRLRLPDRGPDDPASGPVQPAVRGARSGMYEISLLTVMCFSVIFALSLNLITGFCGQISLGHAAFYGIGAYTAALFTTDGGSFWLALPLAMAVAGFFGFIVGFASLRVRHDFLAITTMGVGFLFTGFVRQQEFLGGEEGIAGIPDPGIGQIPYMLLCAVLAAAVIAFSLYVKRSWMGHAFDAIATDEDTARTLGIDVARYKLTAFVFGTALAGLAGALFAHYVKFVEVESFDFIESISVLAMVIVGGIGSVWGVVVAAAFLSVMPLLLQVFADFKLLFYGVLLFAVMYFAPGGIDSLMRMLWRRISGRRTAG